MNQKNIISPCISVCKTDPISGFCYGCGRTNDEKKLWKNEDTSDHWKINNLKEAKNRFYVIDLLLADISLVVTKRSEFNSMLKKVNYDLKVFNETLKNQNNSSYKLFIQ